MGTNNAKQQHSFRTLGLDIGFPFPPYPTQRAMMNKITATLCNHEHALIESPTGTGKTLVLLCSALAWRAKSKELDQPFISTRLRKKYIQERLDKLKARPCICGSDYIDLDCKKYESVDDDDDCQIICKKSKMDSKEIQSDGTCQRCISIKTEEEFIKSLGEDAMDPSDIRGKAKPGVPRIYYGTRTHKQITQVIRELNKTKYSKDLKICILSSRNRTCINEDVRDYSDVNERCQNLISNYSSASKKKKTNEPTCKYYQDSNNLKMTYSMINDEYQDEVWDIEQLVEFGRKHLSCPYFGVRKLQEEADITFCPYNYLLDATIRSNLDINIKNSVIIVDEAHNLEDICRDSASFIINTHQIDAMIETLNIVGSLYVQGSAISDAISFFRDKMSKLKFFLVKFEFDQSDYDSFDKSSKKILTNERMLTELESMGLGRDTIQDIKSNLKSLKGDDDDIEGKSQASEESSSDSKLTTNQLQFIRQLAITLEFMYKNEENSIVDFRAVVTKTLDKSEPRGFDRRRSIHQSTDQLSGDQIYIWQLSILCMNPAVAFADIHKDAWSVVVASGTLSPIESLKTELGCSFSMPFEGSHVISPDRIFGSIISHGPTGKDLNCSWANSLKLDFQDEVGRVVADVCRLVPKGVLCFFPSYDRMEKLCERWQGNGIIKEIAKAKGGEKNILKEQKKLTASDFEKVLAKYNKKASKEGAILMAVFRGKVSEGIDFADDAARAVITIGIPYPNVKEVGVGLKKEYNDNIRTEKPQVMTGGDWYASQAFRALNQALGRCIRHKEDWGAIILIDSRLKWSNQSKNLSKWFTKNLVNTSDYKEIHQRLKDFVDDKKQSAIE